MSTLGDFCGTALGDFMGSALGDRGCERVYGPGCAHGCSFLPHTFSFKLSGISGSLVYYEGGEPSNKIGPFDLSVCNRNYSVSLPAWGEPGCRSSGLSPYIGPLLWYSGTYGYAYVGYRCQPFEYLATHAGNRITARLAIWTTIHLEYPIEQSLSIEWSIVLPWTEDDCCHGIGRNLPKVSAGPIGPCGGPGAFCVALSPGTGDGSICTIMS